MAKVETAEIPVESQVLSFEEVVEAASFALSALRASFSSNSFLTRSISSCGTMGAVEGTGRANCGAC